MKKLLQNDPGVPGLGFTWPLLGKKSDERKQVLNIHAACNTQSRFFYKRGRFGGGKHPSKKEQVSMGG